MEICLKNTLVLDRLEGTGTLKPEVAKDHGVLGYVARASGIDIDARRDHPFAAYPHLKFRVPVLANGDVKDRVNVRVEEVHESAQLIQQACCNVPSLAARGESLASHRGRARRPDGKARRPRIPGVFE